MQSIKLLHCADIHLDMPFTSLGSDSEKAGFRRAELRQVFQSIIKLAHDGQVDLLLICGDLFENRCVRKSTISFLCDEFNKIGDIKVVIIPGNHDPDYPGSFYRSHSWPENVHILSGDRSFIEFKEKGLSIFNSTDGKDLLTHSNINIFVAHGTLDMNPGSNTFNPLSSEKLETLGFDYIALGHFHNRIESAGRRGLAFNPGSPEPLGFDEEGVHGVFLAEISKTENAASNVKVDFVSLNRRAFKNITVNTAGCDNHEKLMEIISTEIAASGSENDLYNITLKGTVEKGFNVDKKLLEMQLAEKAFFIRLKDETIPDYDFNDIKKEPGLRGLFVRKMLDRIDKATSAGDESEKMIALKALYFGMEAIEQGEICI